MLGLERGFERASSRIGWRKHTTAAYVEIEAFIVWNLVKQMEQGVLGAAPVHSNIKTFPWEVFRGKIHGIFGGYPCQPFSVAGKGKGVDDPRHLWPYIYSGIQSIMPEFCFFENVRNHLNIGYQEVRGGLEAIGYKVSEGIYSAQEIGAPHKRDRLFILAILANTDSNGNEKRYADRRNPENPGSTKTEQEKRERLRAESSSSSKDVDNSEHKGLERHARNEDSEKRWKRQDRSVTASSFPMGQGQNQYEWEVTRLKSRLGLTNNGYNFTEDLLRMAGNGVVEQVAELAFLDLLRKHDLQ